KAEYQSTSMLNAWAPSRASPLPQGLLDGQFIQDKKKGPHPAKETAPEITILYRALITTARCSSNV
ncbi:hypothetical protein, partial [Pseudomonas sp. GW456-R21]|uniref:hypothetical protein n=1 Tax=Pseudomonas sp. GW456-R21 TaxID=2075554 RepID=UPI000CD37EC4